MSVGFAIVLVLAAIAALGDLSSTIRFRKLGIGEANPLARLLFDRIGVLATGLLLKGPVLGLTAYIGFTYCKTYPAVAFLPLFLTTLWGYGWAVNSERIKRATISS